MRFCWIKEAQIRHLAKSENTYKMISCQPLNSDVGTYTWWSNLTKLATAKFMIRWFSAYTLWNEYNGVRVKPNPITLIQTINPYAFLYYRKPSLEGSHLQLRATQCANHPRHHSSKAHRTIRTKDRFRPSWTRSTIFCLHSLLAAYVL
jgi:hypothetical protein